MNKYELEVPESEVNKDKQIVSQLSFTCQDVAFLRHGRTLICLFEHNLVQVFKFKAGADAPDDFDLS